ncbi:arylformamidase [Paludifilum halophilum]|uniref:Kynurenine formamidase n=1 Tax=Paludifilum halophilum TaxID=1642702 RepID=A0A235BAX0_9BACL|nr:arylformamidase [Paludifilum halophilum]OYD09460.1 arylformamidase [Paludifilum halophilum]
MWIDISQRLEEGIPSWPGDTPFSYGVVCTKEESGSVNVGQITMSAHTGTHIDAPFHFDSQGKRVIQLEVDRYTGPARVIHLPGVRRIDREALKKADLDGVSKLLIRTDAWTDRRSFPRWIPPVEPEVAPFLAEKGIRLIGLDVPSVDPLDSKELPAHHALARSDIHILEGAVLDRVKAGNYELIALPLPLTDADGSPVRAVLRPL